jgi:hypothetical protein
MLDVGVDAWGGYPVQLELADSTLQEAAHELKPLPWR